MFSDFQHLGDASPNTFHHGRWGALFQTPSLYSWSDQLSIYGSQTPLPCLWHFVLLFHSITFQSFAMTTFFVYINYIAPRLVKTYMHCMWSGRQSCVICFVCYRYTCVRVLLWLITTDCLRWATQRSWPLKLSAAIIMTTPVIDATN